MTTKEELHRVKDRKIIEGTCTTMLTNSTESFDTLYLMWPPIAAAILAYSVIGRLLPTADTGRLAMACWLCNVT